MSVYHHLHAWVARLLLHRAQLHFAKDVLDNIPESAYEEDASGDRLLGKLRIHLTSLFEARRHRAILPVFISHEQWWITPPEGRICEASLGGKPIKHWYPGRIEYVANGDISISLGVPPEEGETEADIQTWDVSRQRFDELSGARNYDLNPGRFIELVYYGDDETPRVFVRPEEKHGLPPVFPDPMRYLAQRWGP